MTDKLVKQEKQIQHVINFFAGMEGLTATGVLTNINASDGKDSNVTVKDSLLEREYLDGKN
jgi:hypothetical protein